MSDESRRFVERLDLFTAGKLGHVGSTVPVHIPAELYDRVSEIARILNLSIGDAIWNRIGWMFNDDCIDETRDYAREDALRRGSDGKPGTTP